MFTMAASLPLSFGVGGLFSVSFECWWSFHMKAAFAFFFLFITMIPRFLHLHFSGLTGERQPGLMSLCDVILYSRAVERVIMVALGSRVNKIAPWLSVQYQGRRRERERKYERGFCCQSQQDPFKKNTHELFSLVGGLEKRLFLGCGCGGLRGQRPEEDTK